MFPRTG